MRILFDHGTPAPLQSFLTGHVLGDRCRLAGTGPLTRIVEVGGCATYAASDYLVYAHPLSGTMFAAPFDPARLNIVGESTRVVETSTLFQAASISKPVTAMAAVRLAQDGRVSPVAEFKGAGSDNDRG